MSTSTTASFSMQDCAVCTAKAASRCSGCKTAFFCSREHQKLVYPTHKHLCKGPPDACYFPPLTTAQQASLRARQNVRVAMGFPEEMLTLKETLQKRKWWEGDLESLFSLLGREACPISEPKRSRLIALSLATLVPEVTASYPPPILSNPWEQVAAVFTALADISEGYHRIRSTTALDLNDTDLDPFKRLSSFLRQMLTFSTLLAATLHKPTPPGLNARFLQNAAARELECLRAADLPPAQEASIKGFVGKGDELLIRFVRW
ncbi:hypothetical protein JCM6882_003107 [Rhodosporidiobolus microsporus]